LIGTAETVFKRKYWNIKKRSNKLRPWYFIKIIV
jgi:hypothetical protein